MGIIDKIRAELIELLFRVGRHGLALLHLAARPGARGGEYRERQRETDTLPTLGRGACPNVHGHPSPKKTAGQNLFLCKEV